jgi:hypothetical protein
MRVRCLVALAALAACGGRSTLAPDGGAPDVPLAEVGGDGSGVFTVMAKLTLAPEPGQSPTGDAPTAHAFTMLVDGAGLRVIAGAYGRVAVAPLMRTGATTFATKEHLILGVSFQELCYRVASVEYEALSFSVKGGRLTGTGKGQVSYPTGPVRGIVAFNAVLSGEPDAELPVLSVPGPTIAPMGGASFAASEPLDPSSAASLIGEGGDVFGLGSVGPTEPPFFTTGFVRSPLMLNWGTTYEVTTEALLDLAGHMGSRDERPSVTTPPAPPLVGEDGFESVAGPTFGGAGVLSGGALTPITGGKSLLVGDGLGNLGYTVGSSLAVRLPIQSGDTMVRMSARFVSLFGGPQVTFAGEFRAGVPGREVSVISNPGATNLVVTTLPNGGGQVWLGPVTTLEVPLPLNAAGDVSFEIAGQQSRCFGPYEPSAVLIIDDLRVE